MFRNYDLTIVAAIAVVFAVSAFWLDGCTPSSTASQPVIVAPAINIPQAIADLQALNTAATDLAPGLETQYRVSADQQDTITKDLAAMTAALAGAQSATTTADAQSKIQDGISSFNDIALIVSTAPNVPSSVRSKVEAAQALLPLIEAAAGIVVGSTGSSP